MTSDAWVTASGLVDELVAVGVRDAVLCPGSRSAPLAYALADAEAAGRLRVHVRVDERSAAFLALGLAKASRLPVPVVTTSGTAVANLHPAALEASHAGVPLLLVSADRPAGVRERGGNQTTVQPGMFAAAVRGEWDVAPEADVAAVVRQACELAVDPACPGPVHLNVPLAEPLVPGEAGPVSPPWPLVSPDGPEPGVVPRAPRTLVLLGDVPDPAMAQDAVELASAAGWPVVAEPFGRMERAGTVPSSVLLAEEWVDAHLPERLLVCGRVTLARGATRLLRRVPVVDSVHALDRWPDQSGRARAALPWASLAASRAALAGTGDAAFLADWRAAGEAVGEIRSSWGSGVGVAQALLAATGADLFTGPSNVARDVDLAGVRDGRTVWASRGLAGIDGCVSTAIGIGLATGEPLVALLGDLTFLHDANGLLIGPEEERPDVTLVVLDDDGGGIFATLEHGDVAERGPDAAARFERIFGTPTGTEIEALCAAHGVAYTKVGTASRLGKVLAAGRGLRVVHVPVSRERRRVQRRALAARVASAVEAC